MTVIAWDGNTLAADKRANLGTLKCKTTKIFTVGAELTAFSGDAAAGRQMLAWYKDGAVPADFPETQRNPKDLPCRLYVFDQHSIRCYEDTPYPIVYEDEIFAGGSGRDFAIAAMHLGKTAKEAVEIASLYSPDCGDGVDTLTLPKGIKAVA